MTFRKKPVVIDAIQYTGDNVTECLNFIKRTNQSLPTYIDTSTFIIKTLEGAMTVCKGDWIIRGVQGEFYPCKPDIFDQTYELVDFD